MRMIRGRVYRQVKGNQKAAIKEFERAIAVADLIKYSTENKYAQQTYLADAYYRKGLALDADNQPDAAFAAYLQAEKISWGYVSEEIFADFVQKRPQFAAANQNRVQTRSRGNDNFRFELNALIDSFNKRTESSEMSLNELRKGDRQGACVLAKTRLNDLYNVQSRFNQLKDRLPQDAELLARFYKNLNTVEKEIDDFKVFLKQRC